jgi:LmbE family N-acetylglucosaminyl deacetylase
MKRPAPAVDACAWRRLLIFAPHPDDETLATAGLLQHAVSMQAAIRIVFVTDGEDNPWPQRALERRWHVGPVDRARWAERRRAETMAALARLGVARPSTVFLHYPDRGLTRLLLGGDTAIVSSLAAELAEWRPTLVVAPALLDRHPDHGALAVLLRLAVDLLPQEARAFDELAYVVHGAPPDGPGMLVRLAEAERTRKRAAISCHASQTLLSRRRLLSHVQDAERFLRPGQASPSHRVRRALVVAGSLVIDLAPPTSIGDALPATLDVLTTDSEGTVHHVARTVPPWRRRVVIPLQNPPARLFARCEGPHVFFDHAGWRQLSARPSPAEASVGTVRQGGSARSPGAVSGVDMGTCASGHPGRWAVALLPAGLVLPSCIFFIAVFELLPASTGGLLSPSLAFGLPGGALGSAVQLHSSRPLLVPFVAMAAFVRMRAGILTRMEAGAFAAGLAVPLTLIVSTAVTSQGPQAPHEAPDGLRLSRRAK